MTSIHNNVPANIPITTIDTRAHVRTHITTTHAIRTMDIGYSVSQQGSHYLSAPHLHSSSTHLLSFDLRCRTTEPFVPILAEQRSLVQHRLVHVSEQLCTACATGQI